MGNGYTEFSPEIRYRPGKKNGNADALSRLPLGRRDNDPEPDRSSGDDSLPGVTIPVATITTSNKAEEQVLGQENLLTDVTNSLPEIAQEQRADSYFADIIPADESRVGRIVLSCSRMDMINDVVFRGTQHTISSSSGDTG